MAIYSLWYYTHPYTISHTHLSLFRTLLPIASISTPTAAGTAPRAELAILTIEEAFIYFKAELSAQASPVWEKSLGRGTDFALQHIRCCAGAPGQGHCRAGSEELPQQQQHLQLLQPDPEKHLLPSSHIAIDCMGLMQDCFDPMRMVFLARKRLKWWTYRHKTSNSVLRESEKLKVLLVSILTMLFKKS